MSEVEVCEMVQQNLNDDDFVNWAYDTLLREDVVTSQPDIECKRLAVAELVTQNKNMGWLSKMLGGDQ